MDVIFLSPEITVGYVETSVTVFENDGVATLTVAISMPSGADPIETSFYLLVNTMDGSATAAGLSQCVDFVCVRYVQLPKLTTFVQCFLPFLANFLHPYYNYFCPNVTIFGINLTEIFDIFGNINLPNFCQFWQLLVESSYCHFW